MNAATVLTSGGDNTRMVFTPPGPIPCTESVTVWTWGDENAPRTWVVTMEDGTTFSEAVTSTGSVMTPVTISANGNITQIRSVQSAGAGRSHAWSAVAIDGVLFVDGPAPDKVTTVSPKRGSGTVESINGTEVTISPFTDNCFKPGQWLTVDKPLMVTPVTSEITNYGNLTKTVTVTNVKDLVEFESGDNVFMADEDGNPVSPEITTSPIASITGVPVTWSSDHFRISVGGGQQSWGSGPLAFNGNDSDGASGTGDTNQMGTFTLDKLSDLGDFYCDSVTYKISRRGYETPGNDYGRRIMFYYADGTNAGSDSVDDPDSGTNFKISVNPNPDKPLDYLQLVGGNNNQFGGGGGYGTSTITVYMIKLDGVTLIDGEDYNSDLIFTSGTNISQFKRGDTLVTGEKVLEDGDASNRLIKVQGTNYSVGSTVSVTKTGTGVVESVNGLDIILSESNDGWSAGYYESTDPKESLSSTAYLEFDSAGNVSSYSVNPVPPRTMDLIQNIKLTFPEKFDNTDLPPDVEFADNGAYLQTQIQVDNEYGESEVVESNALVPATTGGYIPAGYSGYLVDDLIQMAANTATLDQRIADNTAVKRQSKFEDFQTKLSTKTD